MIILKVECELKNPLNYFKYKKEILNKGIINSNEKKRTKYSTAL